MVTEIRADLVVTGSGRVDRRVDHQVAAVARVALAPLNWRATLARDDVQHALSANVFRQVSLGNLEPLPARSPASAVTIDARASRGILHDGSRG